jgi:hypothetical protein
MCRAWVDINGIPGGSDHTLLMSAEQREEVAKKAHEEAPTIFLSRQFQS